MAATVVHHVISIKGILKDLVVILRGPGIYFLKCKYLHLILCV